MTSRVRIYWNNLELPQPPQTTISLPSNLGVNINKFSDSVDSLQSLLQRASLESAGGLCSRLIYKNKLKFRTTKWMKLIEKINQAMLKVSTLKLPQVLKKISDSTSREEQQVPSRAMLEWFLLKLQGFARLLVRLVVTSYQAGVMFKQCLAIGHNWHIIVTLMALVSQIWANCQLMLHETFKCYSVVHDTMQRSPLNQKSWSSTSVPDDLGMWVCEEIATLGLEAADIFRIPLPNMKSRNVEDGKEENESTRLDDLEDDLEDFGETISRDDISTSSVSGCIMINSREEVSAPEHDALHDGRKSINLAKLEGSLVSESSHCLNGIVKKKKKAKKKMIAGTGVQHETETMKIEDAQSSEPNTENSKDELISIVKKNRKLRKQLQKMMESKVKFVEQLNEIQNEKKLLVNESVNSSLKNSSPSVSYTPVPQNLKTGQNKSLDFRIAAVNVRKLKRKLSNVNVIADIDDPVKSKKKRKIQINATFNESVHVATKKVKCNKKQKLVKKKGFNVFNVEDVE